jgi:hypothetical protein
MHKQIKDQKKKGSNYQRQIAKRCNNGVATFQRHRIFQATKINYQVELIIQTCTPSDP